ncbi:MAG: hypothetical protein ACLTSX_03130 [Collinsella sp.]
MNAAASCAPGFSARFDAFARVLYTYRIVTGDARPLLYAFRHVVASTAARHADAMDACRGVPRWESMISRASARHPPLIDKPTCCTVIAVSFERTALGRTQCLHHHLAMPLHSMVRTIVAAWSRSGGSKDERWLSDPGCLRPPAAARQSACTRPVFHGRRL